MTTNDEHAPYTNERVLAARIWLNLKVAYLESEGMATASSENERLMKCGEEPRPGSSTTTLRKECATCGGRAAMSDRQVTDFLVNVIDNAIENKDIQLTETAISVLATIDPDKAQDVLDMIRSVAALMIREEAL